MLPARVDAAVGDEPDQVQPPARGLARARAQAAAQDLVLEEAAVGDRVVDPRQVLLDDRPGAEVEVADLGVAHLAVGQADVAAGGGERRVRVALPELVEGRRVGLGDRVAGPVGARPQPSRMTSATEGPGAPRARRGRSCRRFDDRREVVGVEAGAADQRAVDVGLRRAARRRCRA